MKIQLSSWLRWSRQGVTKEDLFNTEQKLITLVERATHNIMAKLSTLGASLEEIANRTDKAFNEIRAKLDAQTADIEKLTQQLGDADLTPEAEASLARLQVSTKALDDIVPDTVPTP